MDDIPIIKLNGLNCWIVNLIPFEYVERDDPSIVLPFQRACIKHKIFGMGWNTHAIDDITDNEEISDDNIDKYVEATKKHKEYSETADMSALISAVNNYNKIQSGDFVVTRLKNTHFYIGRVDGKAKYMPKLEVNGEKRISWGCRVEKWVEFKNAEELPSDIIGRLSQRHSPTIQRIADLRIKIMIISAFEQRLNTGKPVLNEYIPKLSLNSNNFVTGLDYMELEDLVSQFIYNIHSIKGYVLQPSSCKINTQKYEFIFVSANGKPITCQVKNQSKIVPDEYISEDSYEKIYLFSGKWSQEEAELLKKKYQDTNIYVICKDELYSTLTDTSYLKSKFEKFYNITNANNSFEEIKQKIHNNAELRITKGRFTANKIFKVKENKNENLIYIGSNKCFYSHEFNAIFDDSSDTLDNEKKEKNMKEFLDIVNK